MGLGCTSVVVDDEESDGIYLPELVSAIVRFKTATKLSNTISRFRQLTVGVFQDDPLLAAAALDGLDPLISITTTRWGSPSIQLSSRR